MSRLSRSDRAVAAALLAVLLGVCALLAWGPDDREAGHLSRLPSTFSAKRHGVKAAYLVLEQLGRDVARVRRPLSERRLGRLDTLFLLEPVLPLSKGERAALLAWVDAGGTLVVAPNAETDLGLRTIPFASPDASVRSDADAGTDAHTDADAVPKPWAGEAVPVEWRVSGDAIHGGRLRRVRRLAFAEDVRLGPRPAGPLAVDVSTVLWRDPRGPMVQRVDHGAGAIYALAGASPLSNAGLRREDNALLLAALAQGRVGFDELHLGFPERDVTPVALAKLTFDERWRPAALQGALAMLLALFAGAVRFGRPVDAAPPARRRAGELAESAGRLYRDAGAHHLVLARLYRHYYDALCAEVGLAPDADDALLRDRIEARLGTEAALDPRATLDAGRAALADPAHASARKTVALARRMHRLWEATRDAAR
ncbi:MAG: DUF4350 domain-containing protein [Myxococcales bacterium]|nr:DUF4350 domain-containing protein [Myxococcales bacterium]